MKTSNYLTTEHKIYVLAIFFFFFFANLTNRMQTTKTTPLELYKSQVISFSLPER